MTDSPTRNHGHDHAHEAVMSSVGRLQRQPNMTVGQMAADYAGCREVFQRYNEPQERPGKFGHLEPLEKFARRHDVSFKRLLNELATAALLGILGGFAWSLAPSAFQWLGPASGGALLLPVSCE